MVTADKVYTLEEATDLVRKFPTTKFNQTVSLSFRLSVDPKRS